MRTNVYMPLLLLNVLPLQARHGTNPPCLRACLFKGPQDSWAPSLFLNWKERWRLERTLHQDGTLTVIKH